MQSRKIWEILESTNFRTNLFTFILAAFAANGAEIPEGTAEGLSDAITSANLPVIITMVLINVINPIIKIFKDKVEDFWSFTRSTNFYTNLITLVLSVIIWYGAEIPEGTAQEVVEAVRSQEYVVAMSIVLLNVVNPILHIFKKKENAPTVNL